VARLQITPINVHTCDVTTGNESQVEASYGGQWEEKSTPTSPARWASAQKLVRSVH